MLEELFPDVKGTFKLTEVLPFLIPLFPSFKLKQIKSFTVAYEWGLLLFRALGLALKGFACCILKGEFSSVRGDVSYLQATSSYLLLRHNSA